MNVDVDMLKESKKNRKVLPDLKFGKCIRAKSTSGDGTGAPKCPVFG